MSESPKLGTVNEGWEEAFPQTFSLTFATPVDASKAETLFQRLNDALVLCQAQAHYFVCHSINGHPSRWDDGTCKSDFCVKAREALSFQP